ncbi:MAG: GGDEF domain-containing protein [Butyrivibrio sp.]|nr:GGDEF domain-containing protein [Butyrivibrio sp.]
MTKPKTLPVLNSLLIAVAILTLCTLTLTQNSKYQVDYMDEGWDLTVNNKLYENVTISKIQTVLEKDIKFGDHIVLARILPDIGPLPNPTLIFRTRYTTLNCYLDGELIYSFGDDLFQKNNLLGKMYQFITLDNDYAGKILVFDMYAAENDPFVALDPVVLGSHDDIAGALVHSNLIIIATGVFLFIFGIAFFCIALLFISNVPEISSLLMGAVFCMNTGAWLLAYYNVLSFFVYTTYETQIEYFTLYLIIPYCYLLILHILKLKKDRIFMALMYISFGITLFQYVLHYVFNIHLITTLPLYHVTGLVGFGVLVYYSIMVAKDPKAETSTKVQMTGLLFFATGLLMHYVIYTLEQMNIKTQPIINMLLIAGGCLLFAMCQLSTYLIFIAEHYARKQENISLSHLAYADGLTNLANRAKADKTMEDLDESTEDYCIISIDLNGLKPINDEFGHPTGDRYIKDFSKVLSNTFGDRGLCARVGGDEFLVILMDTTVEEIEALIGRMNSALNVMNALYTEYERSVSAGYAFRHEFSSPTAHKVYLRADQRMYEEKRKIHEEKGVHTRL